LTQSGPIDEPPPHPSNTKAKYMAELDPTEGSLRTYLQVLRGRFYWVLAFTVLAVGVAVVISKVEKKQYSATAQLLVQPVTGSVPVAGTQQSVSPTDVLTELQLMTSAPVKAQAAKQLGFQPNISAQEAGQTNVITVTATARTPSLAAGIASTYAKVFVASQRSAAINALSLAELQYQSQINAINAQIQPLQSQKTISTATSAQIAALASQVAVLQGDLAQLQITGAETPGGIEIVSLASPPSSPSSPKPLSDGLIALVIGLLLGVGAAFVLEYFDDDVYTKDEVEQLSGGVPVLAVIPQMKSWKKSGETKLISEEDPFSPVTEAYRSLRTSLQFAGHDGHLKTILVTSAAGSEGKTSTVANLGVILANAGERVVVVSCDLRRPRLGRFLGQPESPGFTSVLLGQGDLQAALQPVSRAAGLTLLGTGPIPPNPTELLGSPTAAEIFGALASDFDVVLIDSPPLLPVADALVLSSYADAVLLVVAAGQTKQGQVERAAELLSQANARPTGIVLNKVGGRSGKSSDYTYGFTYQYAPQRGVEVPPDGNGLQPAGPKPPKVSQSQQRSTVS
jgi:polysaccharide biosynthesis transport protein